MEFKFDANQDFQREAIRSIVELFDGQPRIEAQVDFPLGTFAVTPNRLDVSPATILENLQIIQERSSISKDNELLTLGENGNVFLNFSVEMETGTGKTYVYLRTALELYQQYGLRKFIIVVPSIAIREGVLKTFQITKKHFAGLYGNVPYRFYTYDAENLAQVRQFALSSGVEFLIMTIDSFNKATNVIGKSSDRLQGDTPLHLIQAVHPILILDEPQNMESELRIKALCTLQPLCALRYSATHRNHYNLAYRLTPFAAYRQGLVKRIEVAGIERQGTSIDVFLRLEGIKAVKNTLTATVTIQKLMKTGAIRDTSITVKPGENLSEKSGRPEYAPYTVEEINAGEGWIRFTNGAELRLGEATGQDKSARFAAQIRYTIESHFAKQARLKEQGIKVLSLFFIDKVDNYAPADGIIRTIFIDAFNDLKKHHPAWQQLDPEKVQAAYFAAKKTRTGDIVYEDTKTGDAEKDKEAYDLIMRNKERLLSFDEPTSFIFTHSALREGWDNPNVFQICTLNQSTSEIRKRQEIGRGVRLCVNQDGDRVHDERLNVLTVVANNSYERYVAQYQSELEDEYGATVEAPPLANARRRATANLRKAYLLKPEFKELWNRIKHKTRYAVAINTITLVTDAVNELDKARISALRFVLAKARLEATQDGEFAAIHQLTRTIDTSEDAWLPDIVSVIEHLLNNTTPPVRVTRSTINAIVTGTTNKAAILRNPYEFATITARIIQNKLGDQLVEGIKYEKTGSWYEMTQFDASIESWEEYLIPSKDIHGKEGTGLYDHVAVDSVTERSFVEGLEHREDVLFYVKLPSWFTVDTPVGTYNPDWAIVMQTSDGKRENKLYLVRETKSSMESDKQRPDERRKISCGQRHFTDALGVDYRVVTSVKELP